MIFPATVPIRAEARIGDMTEFWPACGHSKRRVIVLYYANGMEFLHCPFCILEEYDRLGGLARWPTQILQQVKELARP